jgi:RNA polymerase sigma-70 factor (ECF subfamily)
MVVVSSDFFQDAIAAARRAWPDVSCDEAAFRERITRAAGSDDVAALEAVSTDDLYLATACGAGDRRALEAFERRYLSRVAEYVAPLHKPPTFVDELAQRLRERLFVGERRRIDDYSGRGSLEGWVRVTVVRLGHDMIDAERRHEPSATEPSEDSFGVTSDPELAYLRQRYLPQFRAAFEQALKALSPMERNLLRFYLVDKLTLEQMAPLFKKSRATVGRLLVECRERLLVATQRALAVQLGAKTSEVESLVTLLQSQLDVSIQSFLTKSP